ncbi:MAG: hypothetical protein K2X11_15520 [Acetobacteraceae bacterium]|nr:hypothetical protein [Acetobacteraceae bacterium]
MSAGLIHLADEFLMSFMLILALVPVALVWQDNRRRRQEQDRLRALRREARVTSQLQAAQATPRSGTTVWATPTSRG